MDSATFAFACECPGWVFRCGSWNDARAAALAAELGSFDAWPAAGGGTESRFAVGRNAIMASAEGRRSGVGAPPGGMPAPWFVARPWFNAWVVPPDIESAPWPEVELPAPWDDLRSGEASPGNRREEASPLAESSTGFAAAFSIGAGAATATGAGAAIGGADSTLGFGAIDLRGTSERSLEHD